MKEMTKAEVKVPSSQGAVAIPEFGRWQDVQRLFGIKRGTLYNLIAEGKVKSVSMRRKGNVHGVRLFYLPSIRDYLHSLLAAEESQSAEPSDQPRKTGPVGVLVQAWV